MNVIQQLFEEARIDYIGKTSNVAVYSKKLPSSDRTDFEEMLALSYQSQDIAELIIVHILNVFRSTGKNVIKLGGSLLCKTLIADENIDEGRASVLKSSMKPGGTGFCNDRHMKKFSSILKTERFFKVVNKSAGKGGCNVYVLVSKEIRASMGRPHDDDAIAQDLRIAEKLAGLNKELLIDEPDEQFGF